MYNLDVQRTNQTQSVELDNICCFLHITKVLLLNHLVIIQREISLNLCEVDVE